MKIYDGNNCELDKKDSESNHSSEILSEAKSTLSDDDLEISEIESKFLLEESKRFLKNISHKRKISSAGDDEKKILSSDSDDSDEDCYMHFKRQSMKEDEDSSSDEDYLPVDTSENKSSSGSSAEEDLPEELPKAETKAIMTASKDFVREEVMQRRRSSLRQKEKRLEHHQNLLENLDNIEEFQSENDFQTYDVEEMTPDEKLYKKFRAKVMVTVESIEQLSDGDSSDEDFCPVDINVSHDSISSDDQMEISDGENVNKDLES